jgi:hypothetical protein
VTLLGSAASLEKHPCQCTGGGGFPQGHMFFFCSRQERHGDDLDTEKFCRMRILVVIQQFRETI